MRYKKNETKFTKLHKEISEFTTLHQKRKKLAKNKVNSTNYIIMEKRFAKLHEIG